jgi:hypothetical protein
MKYSLYSLFLMCLVLTTGCVYDDLADCSTTILIRFSYTGDGTSEIFNERIEHADVYIYDRNHRMVAEHELSPAELASRSTRVILPPGENYQVVCVGNAHTAETHHLYEGTAFDSKLMHPVTHPDIDTGDRLADSHDHLYHGHLDLSTRSGESEGTVRMGASHHDMIVEVAGYDRVYPTRAAGDPLIEHEGLPAWVDFSNTHSADEHISQFPQAVLREDVYVHEYCVLRHLDGSVIHVKDPAGATV